MIKSRFLTKEQRKSFFDIPEDISDTEIFKYYTFFDSDLMHIKKWALFNKFYDLILYIIRNKSLSYISPKCLISPINSKIRIRIEIQAYIYTCNSITGIYLYVNSFNSCLVT